MWRSGAFFIGLAAVHVALAAPTITYLPAYATSDSLIAVRIDSVEPSSGFYVGEHSATVNGSIVRIDGCIDSGQFSVPGAYAVSVGVGPLPAGMYTVEYLRGVCSFPHVPAQRLASSTIEVRPRSANWPPPLGQVSEVYEYFHESFQHYFVTTLEDEKVAIEAGIFGGWTRVAPFPVYTIGQRWAFFNASEGDGRVPLCRFFSSAFAPKSSHFYTVDQAECESVKLNLMWQFEGIVGYVWQASANGVCIHGAPVFRFYNNGQGAAPNHRFTIDSSVSFAMVRDGWTPEGLGPGVAFCVPRPS
jgi:hypothetical protein